MHGIVRANLFLFIAFYRTILTSWFGGSCRFEPSCSDYARQALEEKPLGEAIWLICRRLTKCHPFGSFGLDPLERNTSKDRLSLREQH